MNRFASIARSQITRPVARRFSAAPKEGHAEHAHHEHKVRQTFDFLSYFDIKNATVHDIGF